MKPLLQEVELRHLRMRLKSDFRTSFGLERDRDCILISVRDEGEQGWGECVAGAEPGYSYETVGTAWHVLSEYFVPAVFAENVRTPADLHAALGKYRGHPLARAGLEMALWDLEGKKHSKSLFELIGGVRSRIPVGVSIGIQESAQDLLAHVDAYLDQGYRRVKIKIAPGDDLKLIEAVREAHPNLHLWVDANAAYSSADIELFKKMDAYNLGLIEQPLYEDDLIEHSRLQEQLITDICLDESIHHVRDARHAVQIGACRVINIKPARVSGLSMACEIESFCGQEGIPVWCGGMLETGIGRAANLALASREGFILPGDISGSSRYYEKDICEPEFKLNDDSTIDVPMEPGLGIYLDEDALEAVTIDKMVLKSE
ncbi:MAG: o-succinylbenzoate synthase [Anaerolineales bacterium]|jgi:O-succinylbenzoate synthase